MLLLTLPRARCDESQKPGAEVKESNVIFIIFEHKSEEKANVAHYSDFAFSGNEKKSYQNVNL